MFINVSNSLCKTSLELLKQCRMDDKQRHPTYERLFSVALKNNISGPSALAMALRESEQVINNWSRRGVSKAGAIKAQERFGCSSVWILRGIGPQSAGMIVQSDRSGSDEANYLHRLLAAIPENRRQEAYVKATQLLIGFLVPSELPASSRPDLLDHPASTSD